MRKILIGFVLVIAVLLVVVAMQPSEFSITRSATMNAPQAAAYDQVNDFKKWAAWSPWEKRDPNIKKTYEGAATGNGAKYHWVGNHEVGEGRMTIEESRPSEYVRIKLEFIKPFAATNDTVFTFQPQGEQTEVNWTMSGKHNFIGKAMCLVMNMEKMIGPDFEAGLAGIKAQAEAAPKP